MARILVTEKLAERGLTAMAEAGHDVDVQLGLSPAELLDAIKGADALIVRSATKVTAEVLEAGRELKVVTSNVSNVAQQAALAAVSGDLAAVAMMREAFDRRRLRIHELLNEATGVTCIEPEGAFYAFPSFKAVLDREIRGRKPESTLELAEILLDEIKVAIVPGEAFGAPGYARLSYALGDDDLAEGVTRIIKLFSE